MPSRVFRVSRRSRARGVFAERRPSRSISDGWTVLHPPSCVADHVSGLQDLHRHIRRPRRASAVTRRRARVVVHKDRGTARRSVTHQRWREDLRQGCRQARRLARVRRDLRRLRVVRGAAVRDRGVCTWWHECAWCDRPLWTSSKRCGRKCRAAQADCAAHRAARPAQRPRIRATRRSAAQATKACRSGGGAATGCTARSR
jgi:hypothetical protein